MFWLFLLQCRHLAEIFIFIKMISHIRFIFLVNQLAFLSLLVPTKWTSTKNQHLISSRFERFEHKKSQCATVMWHGHFHHRNGQNKLDAKILLKALVRVDIFDIQALQCSNFGYICKFLHLAKLHVQSLSQIIPSCLKSLCFFWLWMWSKHLFF